MAKIKDLNMDMTEGGITLNILKFALPLFIGNLFQQVYNLVDSVVVGKYLGADALGGVGSVGMISFLFFSLCFGLANGNGVIVSNYFGQKDFEKLKCVIANSAYIIIIAGLIMSIFAYIFADDILRIMKTPKENFEYAYTYMRITCGLTIVVALYNGISSILRALGDSVTPLIFLIVSAIINVFLDLLFVVRLDYGVAGAAYATVISQLIAAIGSIIFAFIFNPYLKLGLHYWKFDIKIFVEEIVIGIPMSFQTAFIAISCAMLQTLINSYGTTVMAAYTATTKVEGIVFQPYNSLGAALSTFAGQNLGAKKYDRIKKAMINAELIVFFVSAIIVLVIFIFSKQIMGIFVDEAEVIDIGSKGMLIAASAYFALGSIYILRGVLNGIKDVTFSMINGALEVGGRIVFAVVLMYVFQVGFYGVWYTNIFTWILVASVAFIRLLWFIKHKLV